MSKKKIESGEPRKPKPKKATVADVIQQVNEANQIGDTTEKVEVLPEVLQKPDEIHYGPHVHQRVEEEPTPDMSNAGTNGWDSSPDNAVYASERVIVLPSSEGPPQQLVDRYNPTTIDGLVGFDPIKAILRKFCENPYDSAWFLLGPSGIGKTTLAMAIPPLIDGQLHHVASRECTLDRVERIVNLTAGCPMNGRRHAIVVDETDQMSQPAQHAFLSLLDKTHFPKETVFIFTANGTRGLEDRFLSRCRLLRFDPAELDEPIQPYLETIWLNEGGKEDEMPDFEDVFKRSKRNVRTAIMNLEMLLMDRNYKIPDPVETLPEVSTGSAVRVRDPNRAKDPRRVEAALRAHQTMRSPGWVPPSQRKASGDE